MGHWKTELGEIMNVVKGEKKARREKREKKREESNNKREMGQQSITIYAIMEKCCK